MNPSIRPRKATRLFLIALVCFTVLVGSAGAQPRKTINIDFDNTTLTQEQRRAVIAKVQQEYTNAVGVGVIQVREGMVGGDVQVNVVTGPDPRGRAYGRTPGGSTTCTVFEGEFTQVARPPFMGNALVNGVAETAAHEAFHALGKRGHDRNDPPTKMTLIVEEEERMSDMRQFSDDDRKVLLKNLGVTNPGSPQFFEPTNLFAFIGNPVNPPANIVDELSLNAFVRFSGPPGAEFGYISASGEFVFQGDTSDDPYFRQTGLFAFIYSGGYNLAVRFDNQISSLENGQGEFYLFNPNPNNPSVLSTACLLFSTTGGQATLVLNATVERTTGGFTRPEIRSKPR